MKISGKLPASNNPVKVAIATPAYGNTFCGEYVTTLFQLLSTKTDISFSTLNCIDYSDIVVSRNFLISSFYFNQPECTHILFMDSDMGFPPELILQMIELDKDVVSAICPKRKVDLERLHAAGDLLFEEAYNQSFSFIGKPGAPHHRNASFRLIDAIGAGILLISRTCIEKMIRLCPEIEDNQKFKNHEFLKEIFEQFLMPFSPISLKERDLSEDISFCHR